MFCKKGVLTNFTKLTGKQLCQSLFFIKFQEQSSSLKLKTSLTLFRMGFFEVVHGWVGQKDPSSLKSVTYILQWWNLAQHTLPKEGPKNIWITWHTPWVLLTSALFHRKSANFAISRNTYIDCILIHNFYLF